MTTTADGIHAFFEMLTEHVIEQAGGRAIRVEPQFEVGDLVVYQGSIEEFTGQTAYVHAKVEQPAGKAFRYRYDLQFKTGRADHVRPVSFDYPETRTRGQLAWRDKYRASHGLDPVIDFGHPRCSGCGESIYGVARKTADGLMCHDCQS